MDLMKEMLKAFNALLFAGLILQVGSYAGIFSSGDEVIRTNSVTGKFLGQEGPSCQFNRGGSSHEISLDRCCVNALQKSDCERTNNKIICGSQSQNYSINRAGLEYCRNRGARIE